LKSRMNTIAMNVAKAGSRFTATGKFASSSGIRSATRTADSALRVVERAQAWGDGRSVTALIVDAPPGRCGTLVGDGPVAQVDRASAF